MIPCVRNPRAVPAPIPATAGIGLRAEHERAVLEGAVRTGWLEVHSENYFGPGGRPFATLLRLRERFPVSLHGIGLGLGNPDPLDEAHVRVLADLVRSAEPFVVSEHLSWNAFHGRYYNDLLPLPYTMEAAVHVAAKIARLQDALQRQILVENLSSYLEYTASEMAEWEFLAEVATRSGCGVLLDVNNAYVNGCNHGYDPWRLVTGIPAALVGEIHLAGHTRRALDDGNVLLIDTHDRPVCEPVWDLYRRTIAEIGPRPTLIEWDAALPALDVLLGEARAAQDIMDAATVGARPGECRNAGTA